MVCGRLDTATVMMLRQYSGRPSGNSKIIFMVRESVDWSWSSQNFEDFGRVKVRDWAVTPVPAYLDPHETNSVPFA
jgi:hypothetical protein